MRTSTFISFMAAALFAGFFFGAPFARAEEYAIRAENMKIILEGRCAEGLTLVLSNATGTTIYSGTIACEGRGKEFRSEEDLGRWNVPEGSYEARIERGEGSVMAVAVTLSKPALVIEPVGESAEKESVLSSFVEIFTAFLSWLKQAILEVGELIAGKVYTRELCVGGLCVGEAEWGSVFGASGSAAPAEPARPAEEMPASVEVVENLLENTSSNSTSTTSLDAVSAPEESVMPEAAATTMDIATTTVEISPTP